MEWIDFRSDTVTHPTPEMREAMARAQVGDDVYGEDPTVNQLEVEAAELLGKEAALFVTSGTQGNLVAILTHCERGHEMILGNPSHVFTSELGGSAALGGVHPRTLPTQEDGTLVIDHIHEAIRHSKITYPRTGLIVLENTHGYAGAVPLPHSYVDSVAELAREHQIRLHIDGARLFNAAVALNVPANRLVENVDSVTFCLSKGLCAPIGSVLVGSQSFIDEARRIRKMLGGGMRQSGIIASAGLIAIRTMIDRLAEDHANAQILADRLATVPFIEVHKEKVKTNFVLFSLHVDAPLGRADVIQRLKDDYGIRVSPYLGSDRLFRAVTHYWITPEHIDKLVCSMQELLS